MRDTSIEAYHSIKDALTPARARVWDALVLAGEPLTGRELNRKLSTPNAHKRLSELLEQGVIAECGSRTCRVTGKRAVIWKPVLVQPIPLKRVRLPKSWLVRLNRLAKRHPEHKEAIALVARLLREG